MFFFFLNWQYGFVNHALELLVLRNYGPEVWEDIKWVYCLLFGPVGITGYTVGYKTGLLYGHAHTVSVCC